VYGFKAQPIHIPRDPHDWALVLAGGQGRRLQSLTTTRAGIAVPKQFCSLSGGCSLLCHALRRAETIAPAQRTCVVVAAGHRRWWQSMSQLIPESNIFVEPGNRGTAIAILLSLLLILRRDSAASVLLLPSDHFVRNEAVLAAAMAQAMKQARSLEGSIVLLGLMPEDADPELGYILPGSHAGSGIREVVAAVEKPEARWAATALGRGALWNSFIFAARGQHLLQLFKALIPEVVMDLTAACQRLEAGTSNSADLAMLYRNLPTVDFSRDIVQRCPHRLRVVPVPACGWSDLGTPRRVAQVLRRERTVTAPASTSMDLAGVLNLAAQDSRLGLARLNPK
jgi:mannose-1-phosphate guanylyltransferase